MYIPKIGDKIYYRNYTKGFPFHDQIQEIVEDCVVMLIQNLKLNYNSFYSKDWKVFMLEDFNDVWFKSRNDLIENDIEYYKNIIKNLQSSLDK